MTGEGGRRKRLNMTYVFYRYFVEGGATMSPTPTSVGLSSVHRSVRLCAKAFLCDGHVERSACLWNNRLKCGEKKERRESGLRGA